MPATAADRTISFAKFYYCSCFIDTMA